MNILPFQFESHEIRTSEIDGVPYICLADVCKAIGHSNPRKAAKTIDPDDVTKGYANHPEGKRQAVLMVNESGLYQFLLSSNVPQAKPFRQWVTKEVLPSIRKTGSYAAPVAQFAVPAWADQLASHALQLNQIALQTSNRVQALESKVEAMPDRITAQVKQSIQALDSRKRRLKELVGLIVQRAKILKDVQPQHAKLMIWSNVYNMAHANASPPASSLAAYVTKAQINTAIQALEMQLTLMGGVIPAEQQELFEEAA